MLGQRSLTLGPVSISQAARGRDGTDRLDDLAILLGRLVVDHAAISMSFLVSL